MCLAVPATVLSIDGEQAEVEMSGIKYKANLSLVEDVEVGDAVLLHAGFAIEKLDPEEARKTLELFEEMEKAQGQSLETTPPPAPRVEE